MEQTKLGRATREKIRLGNNGAQCSPWPNGANHADCRLVQHSKHYVYCGELTSQYYNRQAPGRSLILVMASEPLLQPKT
ncbi:hypothetical protein RRG08_034157 [Elysia crispata]|uniref:Uncharacterized protein n=1 Tax=Elysia crispata TaxID=231223 RepID=A0AAE0ZL38_9GAST|nr:hypothetical protein RRG08_034157 [Elysia crispata]